GRERALVLQGAVLAGMLHIGDVLAGQDREPEPLLGVAPDQVGQQAGTQVADVRAAVGYGAAGVDPQDAVPGGPDRFGLPGPRVVEVEDLPSLREAGARGAE